MTQQLGEEQATKLTPFIGKAVLTKQEVKSIVLTIWPTAPENEVTKAVIICHQYGLNPLMKHVFLVPFNNRKTNRIDWVMVLGIKATRIMAARQGQYSYMDNTPRLMSEAEQTMIFGEPDPQRMWAITKLRDANGNTAQGYGSWPKDSDAYGGDKGNSKFNMACIGSERAAFDRLYPDAIPADIRTEDEQYFDPKITRVVSVSPGDPAPVDGKALAPAPASEIPAEFPFTPDPPRPKLMHSKELQDKIVKAVKDKGYTKDGITAIIASFGRESSAELTEAEAEKLLAML